MIKNVLLAILQLILFLIVFAAGSFLPPFHLQHIVSRTAEGAHIFIWDGLLLATLLMILILGIEAARKRIGRAGLWTIVAYVLAIGAGLMAKLGFMTV